jgi:hypothetical protein
MEKLKIIGSVVALAAYLPLWYGIIKNTVKVSFSTYLLWAMLDGIIATTIVTLGGKDYWLPIGFTAGSGVTAALLLYKKQAGWNLVDTITAALVMASLLAWDILGTETGIIASVSALCLASIPQIFLSIEDPASIPRLPYVLFAFADICSLIGSKSWKLEEVLFSLAATVVTVAILLLSLRKQKG